MIPPNDAVKVGFLMGSASDWPVVQHAALLLDELGIGWEARVLSALGTPEPAIAYAQGAEARGLKVLICAAGSAAPLRGLIAEQTMLPVLGAMMEGLEVTAAGKMLAIGKAGAKNAALLATQILALSDDAVHDRLAEYRREQSEPEQPAVLPTPAAS